MHLGHGHGFQSHINQRLSQSQGHGFSNHRNGPLSHRNTLPHHRIQYLARQDYSNLIVTIMTEGHYLYYQYQQFWYSYLQYDHYYCYLFLDSGLVSK